MVWPGGMTCIWYGPGAWHGICNGMAWWASHGICIGLARYGMVYVIVQWGMAWPVGHDIVYRTTWRGMARYMVLPCGHGMVYSMAWRGLDWYRIWPAGHGMVYGMA